MIDNEFKEKYNFLLIRIAKAELLSLKDPIKFEKFYDHFNSLVNEISKMIIAYENIVGAAMPHDIVIGGFPNCNGYNDLKKLQIDIDRLFKIKFKSFFS